MRARFAPSFTGYLHIGSARTFIFNWLYARHNGGTMILRIDDTDLERNTRQLLESIFDGLKWLGLDWGEQYHQSDSVALHREIADFTPERAELSGRLVGPGEFHGFTAAGLLHGLINT